MSAIYSRIGKITILFVALVVLTLWAGGVEAIATQVIKDFSENPTDEMIGGVEFALWASLGCAGIAAALELIWGKDALHLG